MHRVKLGMNLRRLSIALGIGLTGLLLGNWGSTSAIAQTQMPPSMDSLDVTCKATLFDLQYRVENYKNAHVNRMRLFFVEANATFPTSNPLKLLVVLGAEDSIVNGDVIVQSSALDILKSRQVLLHHANQIVQNCQDIVSVTYLLGEYQQRTFGLVNGTVREFTCTQDPTLDPLPWGTQYCLTRF